MLNYSKLMLGNDLKDLIQLISIQKQFNPNLDAELMYDEIIAQLKKYEGKIIVSNIVHPTNPKRIDKTANFQFLVNDEIIAISNKYF